MNTRFTGRGVWFSVTLSALMRACKAPAICGLPDVKLRLTAPMTPPSPMILGAAAANVSPPPAARDSSGPKDGAWAASGVGGVGIADGVVGAGVAGAGAAGAAGGHGTSWYCSGAGQGAFRSHWP